MTHQEFDLSAFADRVHDRPDLDLVREMVTSAYSIGRTPSWLSIVSSTSARPSGGRPLVPAKMTSSILALRSWRAGILVD